MRFHIHVCERYFSATENEIEKNVDDKSLSSAVSHANKEMFYSMSLVFLNNLYVECYFILVYITCFIVKL